jgi:hypothetical protein
MPQYRFQYQEGLSLSDFIRAFGKEEKCYAALRNACCWPKGFCCPRNGTVEDYGVIHDGRRRRYRFNNCRHQTTATAGTLFDSTKLSKIT